MPTFVTGTVTEILEERPGLQRLLVDLGREPERAYVLSDLVGTVRVGDAVVVNTTAVELGLGTGGWHIVHWNLASDGFRATGPGHIMKLRYTSLQADTGSAEEHESEVPEDLAGMPVAVCGLHSQMAVVAAVARARRPDLRLAYVMTDGAALPIALSDLVHDLKRTGTVDHTLTAGNAFGGDVECVTVGSALAWARHRLDCDAAIVAMGPGITGTGSTLGTTGIEVAAHLDLVDALGGRPLLVPRVSGADARERHQGLSHHTRTVLRLLRTTVTVAVPARMDLPAGHTQLVVDPGDVGAVLDDAGLHVTTMGRAPAEDPEFFRVAGAGGAALDRLVRR